ncbi:MAG: hypothetical protein LUC41_03660 [Clostridiales bacterium]|nr:hypothetical protein [Clostridiales bacterium]
MKFKTRLLVYLMTALLAFTTVPSATVALAEDLKDEEKRSESFMDERDDEGPENGSIAEREEGEEDEDEPGEGDAGESLEHGQGSDDELDVVSDVTYTDADQNTAGSTEDIETDEINVTAEEFAEDTPEETESATIISDIEIEDDIFINGDLIARLYDENKQEITDHTGFKFVWYKSKETGLSGENGWQSVSGWITVSDDEDFDQDKEFGDAQADINVAKSQGGLHWFYVDVFDDQGQLLASTADKPTYVDYAMELLNGSFEEPSLTANGYGGNHEFHASQVPHWKSTSLGSDGVQAIEIGAYAGKDHNYGTNTSSKGGEENGVYAAGSQDAAGKQFAELNANTAGSLYQDVLTAPGTTLNWGLYHRARTADGYSQVYTASRTDTMFLVIMSGNDARKVLDGVADSAQQSTLTKMLNGVLNGGNQVTNAPYTLVSGNHAGDSVNVTTWRIATTSTGTSSGWEHYSGSYEVPDGQYMTRFFFVSRNASGIQSQGNLLDMVEFSQVLSCNIDYYVKDASTNGEYELRPELSESKSGLAPYTHVTPASLESLREQGYTLVGSVTGTASGGVEDVHFQETTHEYLMVAPGSNYLSLYLVRAEDWTDIGSSQEIIDWTDIGSSQEIIDWTNIGPSQELTDWTGIGPSQEIIDWTDIDSSQELTEWTGIGPSQELTDWTGIGPAGTITDWMDIELDDPVTDWTGIGPSRELIDWFDAEPDEINAEPAMLSIVRTADNNRPLICIIIIAVSTLTGFIIGSRIIYRRKKQVNL